MTLTKKVSAALVLVIFAPPAIGFIVFGHWSRDNVYLTLLGLVYLLPILLVALGIRFLFHMKRLAACVYILGTVAVLAMAIASFWGELYAPLLGQVLVPTIVLSFPFGFLAILHTGKGSK